MIIVDVETTGADYTQHSITQIAAIEFERPGNRFVAECRIWDGAAVDPFTLKYNGYQETSLRDPKKMSDVEAVLAFLQWTAGVGEQTIVGENPAFDRDFMRFTLIRNGKEWPLGFRTLDLHTISTVHHWQRGLEVAHENKMSMLRLDETLRYVGLPTEPQPHTAVNGALYETEAFGRLVYGKNSLAEFSQYPLPPHCK